MLPLGCSFLTPNNNHCERNLMVRMQLYLSEKEMSGIKSIASLRGISQTDVIRLAIDQYLEKKGEIKKVSIFDKIAGIWSDRYDPDFSESRAGWRKRTRRMGIRGENKT